MNTTIPAIRSSEPLCPLDERRTKSQLLVKLFVVHFTTIGAFFHLLNLRGEYLLNLRPVFYICAPLVFIAQHVIAAATLIMRIPLVCIRDLRYPSIETDLIRPVESLIAQFKEPSTETGQESQSELGQIRESPHKFGERALRRLGRALVTIAFLVQCSLSLLLYHRRKTHGPDSIALIDEKVFQLAASGTLVGLLTLGVTLRFPGFRPPKPARSPVSTIIQRVMICLGHRRAPILSQSPDTTMSPVVCFFALSITSCLILHASGRIHPIQEFRGLLDSGHTQRCPGGGLVF
ncbi:hypothetical protein IFM58399_05041 [Aspergillus lentulus]|uniref:uncharacterized protein n=1 Tax=Aspergillus lentulus TaxID=293939 RepID=UPI001394AF22|nr:uncharacterized protein IFM58399_05041 [Aspergillus lentulus]GFF37868.1 hypothetical protein IFM58399_05041 [Aspergillus lentulus]